VEVRGLRGVIGDHERMAGPEGKLWIGSAKGNVGHLEAAAGLIGVVKALLTLRNSRITAIPELTAVNPDIDFDGAPIAVADHAIDWPSGTDPRRAAVSAFGLGGSNAHAVLEEAPIRPATGFDGWRCAVPLSARTAEALRAVAQRLHDFLVEHPDWSPASVAWTSQSGRAHHDVRVVVTASTREELLAGLTAAAARRPIAANSTDAARNGVVQRYEAGEDVDWTVWWPAGERPIRVDLPGYPFTRTKHWFSKTPPTQEDD
jgi:acyl transferase domain-containing protein